MQPHDLAVALLVEAAVALHVDQARAVLAYLLDEFRREDLLGLAREEFGAELFVTADARLLQHDHGVHPSYVVEAHRELMRGT